jgi:hypothetical protein
VIKNQDDKIKNLEKSKKILAQLKGASLSSKGGQYCQVVVFTT